MSKVHGLVNNSHSLFQMLSLKYRDIEEDYNNLFISCLVEKKPSHFLAKYKERLYTNQDEEFLRRYYLIDESIYRIPQLSDYYKNYLTFFCRPIFADFKLGFQIHHFFDKKAELFYQDNYGSANENRSRSKNDQHYVQSRHSSIRSSWDDRTNNKTIFNKSTRNRIENNIEQTMILDSSTVSQSIIQLKADKETKRSANDSLLNILISLRVIKPVKSLKKNRKKLRLISIKNSLCALNNSKKTNEVGNKSEMKKNSFDHKFIPSYPRNFKTSIIEFNKTTMTLKNRTVNVTCNKNSLANSIINQKNTSIGSRKNNCNSNCNKQESQSLSKRIKPLDKIKINKRNSNTNANILNQIIDQTGRNDSKKKTLFQLLQNKIMNNKTKNTINENLKKTIVKSQVSTSNTSKNNNVNAKRNNSKANKIINTNANAKVNQNGNGNSISNKTNANVQIKNTFQYYMNFSNNISRNKKSGTYSTTNRSKTKTLQTGNFIGVTTCKGTLSIEDKHTHHIQIKNTIHNIQSNCNNALELLKQQKEMFLTTYYNTTTGTSNGQNKHLKRIKYNKSKRAQNENQNQTRQTLLRVTLTKNKAKS